LTTPRLLGVLAIIFATSTPLAAQEASVGRATVVDGDTISIRNESIRLWGIDAPESSQRCKDADGQSHACGAETAMKLDRFLAESRPTRCVLVEHDRYGRFVGNCFRADGRHVGAWLVRSGLALDWPRYSDGAFAAEQAAAQEESIGLWAGSFQSRWDWRAERSEQPSAVEKADDCVIKGNINARGEGIYHVPGQKGYARTKISERDGERYFCTEEEAQAAGWRRAKQ
jgi:endonuclease YncB( thermonuclease family)